MKCQVQKLRYKMAVVAYLFSREEVQPVVIEVRLLAVDRRLFVVVGRAAPQVVDRAAPQVVDRAALQVEDKVGYRPLLMGAVGIVDRLVVGMVVLQVEDTVDLQVMDR